MNPTLTGVLVTAAASLIVGWLGWLGIRDQLRASREANRDTTGQAAQNRALEAWEALLKPYRDEVAAMRADLDAAKDRERDRDTKIDTLTNELHRWQRVAKTIARWAITMRDQLRAEGREVPAEPDELMTLQIISDSDDDARLP